MNDQGLNVIKITGQSIDEKVIKSIKTQTKYINIEIIRKKHSKPKRSHYLQIKISQIIPLSLIIMHIDNYHKYHHHFL